MNEITRDDLEAFYTFEEWVRDISDEDIKICIKNAQDWKEHNSLSKKLYSLEKQEINKEFNIILCSLDEKETEEYFNYAIEAKRNELIILQTNKFFRNYHFQNERYK